MNAPTGEGPPEAPGPSRPLLGAAAGAAVGVGAWAGLAAVANFWSGFLALGVGALAGLGARRLGARGTGMAAGAAAVALLGILLGQGFAARATHARNLAGEIAAVNREKYDDFQRAADDFDPRMDAAEIPKFAFRHEFLSQRRGGSLDAGIERFLKETAPVLIEWKRRPPPFEEWQARERERLRAGADPWGAYLSDPLEYVSPLDLLCWLLGLAAAARLGYAAPAPRTFRRHGAKPSP